MRLSALLLAIAVTVSAFAGTPVDAPAKTHLGDNARAKLELIEGLPTISVTINGRGPYAFLIDTDANLLAVSARVVRDAELAATGKDQMGNTTVAIRELAFGGARFETATAAVEPFLTDSPHDGILGTNVFRDLTLVLDFPKSEVRLSKNAINDESALKFTYEGDRLQVPIRIGTQSLNAIVNSGAQRALLLPNAMRATLTTGAAKQDGSARGPQIVSVATESATLTDALEIGRFTIRDPRATFLDRPRAHLGMGVLKDFVVSIDQRRNTIALAKP